MPREIVSAFIISGLFLTIFLIAELWKFFWNSKAETTRKFVHFAGGLVSLSFSYVFKSHWIVLLLCIGFVSIIAITKKLGLLNSVHGVDRKSEGGVYHPIAIYLTFMLSSILHKPIFYLLSILVLSVSDALAALIGKSYGFKLYQVEKEKKSLEGSIIFFFSTFLIIHTGLLLFSSVGRLESVLIALLIAILVTAFEAISLGGADNLFIPLGTLFILSKNFSKSPEELAIQLGLLGFIFMIIFLIAYPAKKLGISGIIGLALLGYAAWAMVSPFWFIPIFVGTVLISSTDLFVQKPKNENELHRIRPVFYILVVPLVWIFASNLTGKLLPNLSYLYLTPFMIGILAQLSILWKWKCRFNLFDPECKLPKLVCNANLLLRAILLILIFGFTYFLVYTGLNPIFSIITCILGIMLSDWIYWFIANKKIEKWQQINFLHMGMAVTACVSFLVLISNWLYYIVRGINYVQY